MGITGASLRGRLGNNYSDIWVISWGQLRNHKSDHLGTTQGYYTVGDNSGTTWGPFGNHLGATWRSLGDHLRAWWKFCTCRKMNVAETSIMIFQTGVVSLHHFTCRKINLVTPLQRFTKAQFIPLFPQQNKDFYFTIIHDAARHLDRKKSMYCQKVQKAVLVSKYTY